MVLGFRGSGFEIFGGFRVLEVWGFRFLGFKGAGLRGSRFGDEGLGCRDEGRGYSVSRLELKATAWALRCRNKAMFVYVICCVWFWGVGRNIDMGICMYRPSTLNRRALFLWQLLCAVLRFQGVELL